MFRDLALDALVFGTCATHVFLTPYAKVEESFNLQATHDVLYHGWDLASYDHHAFPGVVPRTFLGAFALALASRPFSFVLALLGLGEASAHGTRLHAQVASRLALAALVCASLARFRRVLRDAHGRDVATCFALVTATQFHLPFYASRTLPNTFALVLTTLALADWIADAGERADRRAVFLLVLAAAVFRCDVALLLAPVGVHLLATRRLAPPAALGWGLRCLLACAAWTIVVDGCVMWRPPEEDEIGSRSFGGASVRTRGSAASAASGAFWPGPAGVLWPELRVAWFNSVENKSHLWGTSPWHWYLTSALPRALLLAYPLALAGFLVAARAAMTKNGGSSPSRGKEARSNPLAPAFYACAFYVGAYSFLPHKELRFLFPALPACNYAASVAVASLLRWSRADEGGVSGGSGRRSSARRRRSTMRCYGHIHSRRVVVDAGLLGGWVCCAAAHAVFAAASRRNYPGGVAFAALHASRAGAPGLVHVDAAAAMTGVSRFGEAAAARGWAYSKETSFVDGELRRAEALKDDARTMKDASSEDEDEEDSEEDEDSNEDTRASPHSGSSEGLHSSPREDDREAREAFFAARPTARYSVSGCATPPRGFALAFATDGFAGMRVARWRGVPVGVYAATEPMIWVHERRGGEGGGEGGKEEEGGGDGGGGGAHGEL